MSIGELLDEEAFDAGKLFDKEQYNTLVISREGISKREGRAADLLEALLDRDVTRTESEEIFSSLKELNTRELMIAAIEQAPFEREKSILIGACWESGLDFTPHFLFFAGLATAREYSVALEALTVMQNCGTVDTTVLDEALAIAQRVPVSKSALVAELIAHLNSRKNQ